MAIDPDKIVTFTDLKTLVDTEGFLINNSFDTVSLKAVTKAELKDALHVCETDLLATYASNRLVPRKVIEPRPTVWVGYNGVCEQDEDLRPTTPELITFYDQAGDDHVINSWTQSFATAVGASVDLYQLLIELDNGTGFRIFDTYSYTPDDGRIDEFYRTGYLSSGVFPLERDCADYRFQIRARDSRGTFSFWSNVTHAYPVLKYPSQSDRYRHIKSNLTTVGILDSTTDPVQTLGPLLINFGSVEWSPVDNIFTLSTTNNGYYVTHIIDRPGGVGIHIYKMNVRDDYKSIDLANSWHEGELGLSGSQGFPINGGFLSDDTNTLILLTHRVLRVITRTGGWAGANEFGYSDSPSGGDEHMYWLPSDRIITDNDYPTHVEVDPTGKKFFVSYANGDIDEFLSDTAWRFVNMRRTNTLQVAYNLSMINPNVEFKKIIGFAFTDNGKGLVVDCKLYHSTPASGDNFHYQIRVFITLSTAYHLVGTLNRGYDAISHGEQEAEATKLPYQFNSETVRTYGRTSTHCTPYLELSKYSGEQDQSDETANDWNYYSLIVYKAT